MKQPDVDAMEQAADVKGLMKALGYPTGSGSGRQTIPEQAAYALGRVCVAQPFRSKARDTRPVKALLEMLGDARRPAGDREGAAFALDQIWGAPYGGEAIADPSTMKVFLAVAGDRSAPEKLRHKAIMGLRSTGPEGAYPVLLGIVQDKTESHLVRVIATTALGSTGGSRALEPLLAALQDDDPGVRSSAALGLSAPLFCRPEIVEPLLAAFATQDSGGLMWTAQALGGTGDHRAVEALIGALGHEDFNVRAESARALGKIGDRRAIAPLQARLTVERDTINVQGAVEDALKALGAGRR
jgi:HEAT repeat protein